LTLDFSAVFEFFWEGYIAFEVSVAKKKKNKKHTNKHEPVIYKNCAALA